MKNSSGLIYVFVIMDSISLLEGKGYHKPVTPKKGKSLYMLAQNDFTTVFSFKIK